LLPDDRGVHRDRGVFEPRLNHVPDI
jgi:hypothetical protein